jgi:hypothetical protein
LKTVDRPFYFSTTGRPTGFNLDRVFGWPRSRSRSHTTREFSIQLFLLGIHYCVYEFIHACIIINV